MWLFIIAEGNLAAISCLHLIPSGMNNYVVRYSISQHCSQYKGFTVTLQFGRVNNTKANHI